MISFIKKSISYIVSGSCSIVFAACYGPPVNLENPKQINTKNSDSEAIPGLKVTLFENKISIDEQFTNNSGSAEFFVVQKENQTYTAKIEDVDGIENLGEFKTKELDITSLSLVEVKLENIN
jgi:hypothetical protein